MPKSSVRFVTLSPYEHYKQAAELHGSAPHGDRRPAQSGRHFSMSVCVATENRAANSIC